MRMCVNVLSIFRLTFFMHVEQFVLGIITTVCLALDLVVSYQRFQNNDLFNGSVFKC